MSAIVLLGSGALASDLIEMFGVHSFVGAFCEPGYQAKQGLGVPIIDSLQHCRALSFRFLLAAGDPVTRRKLLDGALNAGLSPCGPMISPLAFVSPRALFGDGCVVGHFGVVGPCACLAPHVLVMHNAVIGHDSVLGENAVVCAGASIAGGVHLGADCFVGPNAAIAPGVFVHQGSHLAAGCACLRNVCSPSTLIGNPARGAPRAAPLS